MSSGSRTTAPRWDIILAALDLGLQAWQTDAPRARFIDAIAELDHARVAYEEEHAVLAGTEEALRRAEIIISEAHDVLWAQFHEWEGENGRRESLNAKMWELHNLIRPTLVAVSEEEKR